MNTFTEDSVTLELSINDFRFMILILGIGIETLAYKNNLNTEPALKLVNKINEGNPRWIPYSILDIERLVKDL